MKKDPLVSIVTSTCYEVSDGTLKRAILSVRGQTYANWELNIVADCSPPQVSKKIEELIAGFNDPRIHYYNLPEKSSTAFTGLEPKKEGVRRSGGELLCFLDADNEFTPDHLTRSVAVLAEDPALDFVYCDAVISLLRPFPLVEGLRFVWRKPEWDEKRKKRMKVSNFIDMGEPVMRRSSYEAAGGLKPKIIYATDWALWRDMIEAGRDRFRHDSHIGFKYYTSSLQAHLIYFGLMLAENNNLPFDMEKALNKRAAKYLAATNAKQQAFNSNRSR